MKSKNFWITISILNLAIVAVLGFILRSKILFSLPSVNYLNLLNAHFHFAFDGWITLALVVLMTDGMLPTSLSNKPAYRRIFGLFVALSYALLAGMAMDKDGLPAKVFTYLLIFVIYIFAWVFLGDIRKVKLDKSVRLLSVSAIACLIISTAGSLTSAYLHFIKSSHLFYYTDASYVYLHFQYNGFFTLSVFALLFHKIFPATSGKAQKRQHFFSVLLCSSVIPSLFLSFLWQNPDMVIRIIALTGSLLIFVSVTSFIFGGLPVSGFSGIDMLAVRYLLVFSIAAFIIKMFLQSLTIFPEIGTAVFGDRPVIIGFLHLVFLGFITPFILAYYTRSEMFCMRIRLTGIALIVFMTGVFLNEMILMLQGLGVLFLKSSFLFSWLLWAISIILAAGALLIFAGRIKSTRYYTHDK